jgi:hypothetical protein
LKEVASGEGEWVHDLDDLTLEAVLYVVYIRVALHGSTTTITAPLMWEQERSTRERGGRKSMSQEPSEIGLYSVSESFLRAFYGIPK